ncbi:flagellar motor switch protein FliN [Endozoicomonas arenosclerae]|uniref:flagellar motor switch protein FliN n=1 Tax=Endozoicomonas arenosclerae TaxID=1633495 RepID=UPI000782B31E|nr:flagellar motor switch protein FliN [Endozoicomonas arenosclerae]
MSDQDDQEPQEGSAPEEQDSQQEATRDSATIIEEAVSGSVESDDEDSLEKSPDLGLILDIPVTLSLELGSTQISIADLLRLNKGSVVELEKEASEPLDVKVNGTLIAYAEVVVINDRYGIRLTDVVSESERIKKLS